MKLPVYELKISENLNDDSEVSYVALVDAPAIQKDFLAFKEEFINPSKGEHKDEFLPRCIKYVIDEGKSSEQAVAICNSLWDEHFAEVCPPATQDIAINLKNRQIAIDVAHYGPLNPNLPNEEYWTRKGKQFNTTAEEAKKSRCANCSFFNVSKAIKDCIAKGIGNELDPYNVINAGDLGYCEAFDFKCASQRTCDAWVVGGPVKMAGGISFDYDGVLSTSKGKELAKEKIDNRINVYIVSARNDKQSMLLTAKELGIPESRVFATGSNKAKVEKIKELGVSKHYDNNADVIKELGSLGEKFDDNFADTYNDYPKKASDNAQTALDYAEKNGWGSCGTSVGKIRANQLAKGENISRDTIARMAGFERHRQNSDRPLGEGCGRLMWLAWGGDEGIAWAQRKLKQIDSEKLSKFQVISEDEHIISGPLMIADMPIYRNNEKFGEHYVTFSADTIKQIAIKFAKKKYQNHVNLMHDSSMIIDDCTMFESFIVDKKRGILPMKGFEDVTDGSWFGSFYVENPEVWNNIKDGFLKGFSVEGVFDYNEPTKTLSPEEQALAKISELLNVII